MFRFLRIERPTTATLRPVCTATSIACCIRWTFDANEATRIRPGALRDDLAERLADEPLGAGETADARRSSSRRAAGRRRGCRSRRAARRRCGSRRPACGRASSRSCAAPRPASVSITTATLSGTECAMRTNSSRNGPSSTGGALRVDLAQLGRAQQAVLVELRLDEAERQAGRPHLGHLDLAHQVRQPADVVLVRVREHDRAERARAVPQIGEVGKDEVDARDARRAGTRARHRRRARPRSCSNTVMFFPTSPSPPSGITRRKDAVTGRSVSAAGPALRRPRVSPVRGSRGNMHPLW